MSVLEKFKFEYLFATMLLAVLSVALFYFAGQEKVVLMILGALVAAISSITTYFFTKHIPGQE